MPIPIIYGLGAGLARLAPAAVKGYRTLKGIRAARKAAGMPMGYQKALGLVKQLECLWVIKKL